MIDGKTFLFSIVNIVRSLNDLNRIVNLEVKPFGHRSHLMDCKYNLRLLVCQGTKRTVSTSPGECGMLTVRANALLRVVDRPRELILELEDLVHRLVERHSSLSFFVSVRSFWRTIALGESGSFVFRLSAASAMISASF